MRPSTLILKSPQNRCILIPQPTSQSVTISNQTASSDTPKFRPHKAQSTHEPLADDPGHCDRGIGFRALDHFRSHQGHAHRDGGRLWDRRPLPAFHPSIIRPSGPIRRQSVPSQWNPSSNSFNNYVVRLCDRCRRTHLGRILSTLAPLKTRRPPCLTTRKPSVELLTATN